MRQMPRTSRILAGALPLFLAPVLTLAGAEAGGGLNPGGVPNPPLGCAAQCDAALERLLAPCASPDGMLDAQCVEDIKRGFDHAQCVADCEAQNVGVDPAVLACHGACYNVYANGLEACTAPDGSIDPGCVAASDIAFVDCFRACGDVPWLPDQGTCTPACTEAYRGAFETCRGDDGGIDLACFKEQRGAYNDCLGACGLSLLPLVDVCARRCERAFQAALEQCGVAGQPNGMIEPGDQECVASAQSAFDACLLDCGITLPEEIRCAGECDQALKVRLAECNGDADCENAALDDYTLCLQGCGLVVPPIPEPDPCLSRCDLEYQEAAGQCYDQATGEVDAECLRRVDGDYLACLEGCGVILPEPPPDANPECTFPCEIAYQLAIEKCYTAGADGIVNVDQECAAAADGAYIRCLESCGIMPGPFPGDPGFPIGACEQGCGAEILGALFDCAAENNGAVGIECLARAGDAFNQCLAACQVEAGERVLGALARTANRPFLRGDADLSGTLEITDPIQVLSYLFLGSTALFCEDAADANDDGALNISDASAILGHLFLGSGPLPAPSGSPGMDPTSDALVCDGR